MQSNGHIKIHRKMLDWEWIDKPETVSTFLILLLMANWEDEEHQGVLVRRGQLLTTYKRIGAIAGLTEKQLRTAMMHLEKTGEITKKTAGKRQLITIEKYELYQGDTSEKGRITAGKGQEKADSTNYIRNKEIKKYIYMRFEDFWKLYPKKKGKESAKKAWEKLNPSDELVETILSAVQKQASSSDWTKDGGQFIPYPATWLNGHRWEDEEVEQLSELERWARGELL